MTKNFAVLFSILLFAVGCAEKPKSVGNGLPNVDGIFTIADTVLYSFNDTTYRVSFSAGFGTSNLTGRISATEELITLLNFIPNTRIDSLRGAVIDTAELRLIVNYRYFPQTPPIRFDIIEIQKSWAQSTFTKDSLPFLTFGTKVLGTFADSMNYLSTVKALLDTVEVRKWADSHNDTTAPDFFGFALQAQPGANTGVIGFSTLSNYSTYAPQLFIRFTRNGRKDSLTFASGEDTYVSKYTGPTTVNPLMVHGAFGVRSKIHFNTASLKNNPIINNATLQLTLDTVASSIYGYSPDTVIALIGMSGTTLDQSDSTIYTYGYRSSVDSNMFPVYTFNLTKITDRWVRYVNPNFGLTLRWGVEYSTAEKAVFFSSAAADTTVRPRLKIIYSKK
ncbi:MAG: hypothetical protein WCW35_10755 [Bacteroidota bacterium]|jgi:hypothetical protein